LNSRKITASITVNSPLEDVWSIITDYDNLAVHVPNLVKSYVVPHGASSTSSPLSTISIIMPNDQKKNSNGEIRIFQEGAQKIVGFDFRASLILDMKEGIEISTSSFTERKLTFKLAESAMFSSFDGTWSMRTVSSPEEFDFISNEYVNRYKTLLTYTVLVKPKGVVPVIALEWRIKEDVPTNLIAMKIAAEKVTFKSKPLIPIMKILPMLTNWGADETLGIYTSKKNRKSLPIRTSNSLESTEIVELLETSEKLTSVLNAINLDRLNAMLVPAGPAKYPKINSRN
jgi:hypothetical protein